VVVSFDGEDCVSKIVSYRDDTHEERKPYTSKNPFTRPWKCFYFGPRAGIVA
jgi:hypothetical protein